MIGCSVSVLRPRNIKRLERIRQSDNTSYTMSSGKRINRITLFKIPDEENRKKLLDIYRGMSEKAVKVRTN